MAASTASTPGGRRRRAARRDAQHGACRGVAPARRPAQAPAAVEDDAHRQALGGRLGVARQQLGIVGQRGAAADGDRVEVRAPVVHERRLSGEEIQRLSPVLVAMRPSSVAASLSSTNGRPRTTCDAEGGVLTARARLVPPAGELDRDPGRAQPREAPAVDLGVGVAVAHTTRAMPAAISASAQGGLRPWWLQGSSET